MLFWVLLTFKHVGNSG
jgi:hypothetical protein